MKRVIIVESPTKTKTIKNYLKDSTEVLSSKGHILKLSTKGKYGLGIDIDNDFKPHYEIDPEKAELVNDLKKACKGKEVLLATDPDREGEAISYHLAQVLGLDLDSNNRIEFHEVTKPALLKALDNPRKINMNLVKSQETRRLLDRIIGFQTSLLLKSRIHSRSAGRVQSVALKLICDLEKEIINFKKEDYYEMEVLLKDVNLLIDLVEVNGSKERILDRKVLEDLKNNLSDFTLTNIKKSQTSSKSQAPFTTSTMQQSAANNLHMSASKTMSIAQKLYEGKTINGVTTGLITYMRTDSTHLSDDFVKSCNEYIISNFGSNYLGSVKEKKQKNAQEAHEAIRPTNINTTPEEIERFLTKDEYRLYKLIYERALASLMADATYSNLTYTFTNTNSLFQAKGHILEFDGHLKISSNKKQDILLPVLTENSKFSDYKVTIKDLETKPKSRYTEASLIKDMEEKGIGRPSTYAVTMQILLNRNYVTLEDRKIVPTEKGMYTSLKLDEFFSDIFNVSYTADMENKLDEIALGNKDELDELKSFYDFYHPLFIKASEGMEKIEPTKVGRACPMCGSDLVYRESKYGSFIACSGFPKCRYIESSEEDKPLSLGIKCVNCKDGEIVQKVGKTGRNKGQVFYTCSNYPTCKTTFKDKPTGALCPKCNSLMLLDKDGTEYCSSHCDIMPDVDVICPKCKQNKIVLKTNRRGDHFYACSGFPKCRLALSDIPTGNICPLCSSFMILVDGKEVCSNTKCDKSKGE